MMVPKCSYMQFNFDMLKDIPKYKRLPVLIVPVPSSKTASEVLYSVRECLVETFEQEYPCSVHSIPSGGTMIRIELDNHEQVALAEFFNLFPGGRRL